MLGFHIVAFWEYKERYSRIYSLHIDVIDKAF